MKQKDLSWLDDVEVEDLLTGDLRFVLDSCGLDVLKKLWAEMASMTIYVSTKELDRAKERYILKNWTGSNLKALCSLLDCSERFVYKTLEKRHQLKNQPTLFESK